MKKHQPLYLLLLLALGLRVAAQNEKPLSHPCGTDLPPQGWEDNMQQLLEARAKSGNRTNSVYTIPVIIHVIHGGQAVGTYPNLPQAQLVSQVLVLNNDYSGTGYNTGNYPQQAYANWAAAQGVSPNSLDGNGAVKIADCGIQFCLATKDTLGNTLAEPGIERISYVSKGWANPASFNNYTNFKNFIDGTVKPQSIWNVTKYLNIWVTDENIGAIGLLGYATFPPLSGLSGMLPTGLGTNTTDGFWCYARSFGSIANYTVASAYYTGYNRGRTCSHEIGHWLGLRHIWGDGNCNATDYCNDTPPGSSSNFGAPAYPFKINNCAGNSPDGEMFMNFMDYTDDPAKYMFTTDQAGRIQTAMQNSPYRMYMGTHGLCSVTQVAATANFNINVAACTGVGVPMVNNSGGFPAPNYTWSATGGTFTPGPNVTSPNINFSTPGIYTVTLSADNGTLSVYTKTINVTSPGLILSSDVATVCPGGSAILTAGGVSTYTWEPGSVVNYSTMYTPVQAQETYTCYATEVNGCTAMATIDLYVSTCTGIEALGMNERSVKIYPNPANDFLAVNLRGIGNTTMVNAQLTDALGKVVLQQQLQFSASKQEQQIDIASLKKGVYVLQLQSPDGKKYYNKFVKE